MNQVKEFLEYIFNAIKIWIIIQPWETGLRVRFGKHIKKLEKGIYFRIPYFDSVYKQEKRLRVCSLPMQTLTTRDNKTITLNGAIGYKITDIENLYGTLYHPQTTISNLCMSYLNEHVIRLSAESLDLEIMENYVIEKLKEKKYGLCFQYFKITNYALVNTYRLIQDQSWINEDIGVDIKS
ncbi:SPFH domain-containing protein [Aquimarina sp. AU58]|uniref:SPFH domain-containing protein n=1 Tax=Aquimarina sp. AU58 TaxID=1874112 RepID=UPI000D6E66BA|nr:SPFH domain-containing protein [Aquimarina sp. AU58]